MSHPHQPYPGYFAHPPFYHHTIQLPVPLGLQNGSCYSPSCNYHYSTSPRDRPTMLHYATTLATNKHTYCTLHTNSTINQTPLSYPPTLLHSYTLNHTPHHTPHLLHTRPTTLPTSISSPPRARQTLTPVSFIHPFATSIFLPFLNQTNKQTNNQPTKPISPHDTLKSYIQVTFQPHQQTNKQTNKSRTVYTYLYSLPFYCRTLTTRIPNQLTNSLHNLHCFSHTTPPHPHHITLHHINSSCVTLCFLCFTAQCNATQRNTTQHNTTQHNTTQHNNQPRNLHTTSTFTSTLHQQFTKTSS